MPHQKLLAKIHIAKKELGLDEETYRAMLRNFFNAESSKYLNNWQARKLVLHFRRLGWQPKAKPKKYDDLGRRDIYAASPAQLRMIEATWHDLYRGNNERLHLRHFLFKMAGVSDLRFLERHQAYQVIEALKAMGARKRKGGENAGVQDLRGGV